MREQEARAFGDKEPFDYYLSAFLSAARSVDYRLRSEQRPLYVPWRATWDACLSATNAKLIKFLIDDRNEEVHESGSSRAGEATSTPAGSTYSDSSGRVEVSGPPDSTTVRVDRQSYYFTIDGVQRAATGACEEYLGLLERMVEKFAADNP